MRTYDECVNYIMDIPKFQGKNSLEDTRKLLDDPKAYDFKIVNIAGTNGKGSVTSYMASILESAGKRAGVFTSPHLVDIRERICINGEMISCEDFTAEFEKVLEAVNAGKANHPSFFEFIFIIAMNYFKKQGLDYVLLETGMGGRLDATNCVENRALSVITQIGLDHTEYLGETIELIAGEKAGIIETGRPVVYIYSDEASSAVIAKAAEDKKSPCECVSRDNIDILSSDNNRIDFSLHNEYYYFEGLCINTVAPYQAENASLAVAAILKLEDESVSENDIRNGLKAMKWPARMEEIYPGIYLDGAHNPNGIEAFLKTVEAIPVIGKRRLLFGVVNDKDYDLMAEMILGSKLFDSILLAPIASQRGLKKDKLEELFNVDGNDIITCEESSALAFEKMKASKDRDDVCFIAGSLYLAGEIKTLVK